MSELWRLLVLVTLSASAVTFVGSAAIWFMDGERRIRRLEERHPEDRRNSLAAEEERRIHRRRAEGSPCSDQR